MNRTTDVMQNRHKINSLKEAAINVVFQFFMWVKIKAMRKR